MAISKFPSKLTLPLVNPGVRTVVEYLIQKFPQIDADIWCKRALEGKLHWHDGHLITLETLYRSKERVYYYREVESEPEVPFRESILFADAEILIADKPPFLPVTPGGNYVNECLQNRLREETGIEHLQSLHRIDRVTSGLVMFSVNPDSCALYNQLFASRKISKTYQAIAQIDANRALPVIGHEWEIVNRLERADPRFLMQVVEGAPNSYSRIRCLDHLHDKALFELKPVSGKTHQLRVHMKTLGFPILYDRYYPKLQPQSADDFDQPLQLLAQQLSFIDPMTGQNRVFHSGYKMNPDKWLFGNT